MKTATKVLLALGTLAAAGGITYAVASAKGGKAPPLPPRGFSLPGCKLVVTDLGQARTFAFALGQQLPAIATTSQIVTVWGPVLQARAFDGCKEPLDDLAFWDAAPELAWQLVVGVLEGFVEKGMIQPEAAVTILADLESQALFRGWPESAITPKPGEVFVEPEW